MIRNHSLSLVESEGADRVVDDGRLERLPEPVLERLVALNKLLPQSPHCGVDTRLDTVQDFKLVVGG